MPSTLLVRTSVFLGSLAWALLLSSRHGQANTSTQEAAVSQGDGFQLTPSTCERDDDESCYEKKIENLKEASENSAVIGLYRPKYLLPLYYTPAPYHALYDGHTPGGQTLRRREVKGQLSFQVPLVEDLAKLPLDLVGAYTQTFFWQVYAESAYFRETNYEPEIFARAKFDGWGFLNVGLSHQSNGQGGTMERSWNRVYVDLQLSNSNLYVSLKPWLVIFRKQSSDLYNPDISKYMGNGQLVVSYKKNDFIASLLLRNHLESRFKRGCEEFTLSLPKMKRFRIYLQAFQGYGQSLAEYDYASKGVGLGFAVNDWL